MSTTSGLSKLGQALSVIFVVSLLALVAELFYVLWRRRFFRRQSTATDGSDAAPLRSSFPTSKELLYLLCWKQHQSRVEPDGGGGGGGGSDPETGCNGQSSSSVEDPTDEVIDILKLQAMRGPSRVLFTIKEEEREDVESSEAEQSVSSASAEKSLEKTRRVSQLSLEECFNIDGDLTEEEEEEVVTVTLVGNCDCEIETPPYSTPCGSPSYYTPSASPIRGF